MRADASAIDTKTARDTRLPRSRAAQLRKGRLRSLALERLEERTLMSTLPKITVNGPPSTVAAPSQTGNLSAPTVVVDPNDPLKMVAIWTVNDPANAPVTVTNDGAFSTDGGKSWTDLQNVGSIGSFIPDFTSTATPQPFFPAVTDPTVAFDAHDNFYITSSAHEADNSAGQITLDSFSFLGATPVQKITDQQVQPTDAAAAFTAPLAWSGGVANAYFSPSVTADANQSTFTGTDSLGHPYTQTDPGAGSTYTSADQGAGDVYLTLSTATVLPLQPSFVLLLASKDGGNTFYAVKALSDGEVANAPKSVVSQGRPADTAGHGATDTGVSGGQVTTVFDDSSSLALAVPPQDRIVDNVVKFGSYNFTANPSTKINNALTNTGNPNTPQTTDIPLTVNIPDGFFSLKDIAATVTLTYPNLSELNIQLVPPTGSGLPTVTLLNNRTNASGTTNPSVGASGANLGPTVFTDNAATTLYNNTGGAASVGNFKAEGTGSGATSVSLDSSFGGASSGQADGIWTLQITDFGTSGTAASLVTKFALKITDDTGLTLSGENTIDTTAVLGQFNEGAFPNAGTSVLVSPVGIGPAPTITSDNTLGAFSPHEGRLYVAYVTRPINPTPTTFPVDDTKITLMYSDDGGITWQGGAQVNDANGPTDGFSGSDRPAFQPALAVDPTTGTLAVSFLDARNDAARSRVATYVATSIDGGDTFSANEFVNARNTAVDLTTGKTVVLSPVPDNQSPGNPLTDKTFGYGGHQGLAFYGGQLFPMWSSNENGGTFGTETLGIVLGQASTAAGPRVVSSTMGPVGLPGDTLNTSKSPDGGPLANAFVVTFDRPIQLSSFGAGNVTIHFVSAYGSYPGTLVPVTGITPVVIPNDPDNDGHFGFTSFKVTFSPVNLNGSFVGDYYYSIAPKGGGSDINSGVVYVTSNEGLPPTTPIAYVQNTGSFFDQNANGTPLQQTDVYSAPNPNDEGDTLPLIVPGPHVVSTSVVGGTGSDNLVLNGTVNALTVVFDRAINPASFTPASVLRLQGPAGLIQSVVGGSVVNGPFTITQVNPTTFTVGFPTQTLSGTYTVSLSSAITDTNGDALDTNLNAGLYLVRGATPYSATTPNVYKTTTAVPIAAGTTGVPSVTKSTINVGDSFAIQGVTVQINVTYPLDPDLTAFLIGPDGTTRVELFAKVGATGDEMNFTGTVFDDTVNPPSPIAQGGPPFFGRYNPQFSLNNAFVKNAPNSFGTWTLEVDNAGTSAGSVGTINNWSLTLLSKVPQTGLGEPVADQATATFRIFDDAPSNRLSSNTWTSIGPAPIVNPGNGAVMTGTGSAIAVDGSDPSGNTVFVGGANGGVWKTTDFLTTSPNGPTWIPLTDFGPTSGMNIGGIAVFPRGNDPTKSIVLVGTGDGQAGTKGIGFLRSEDGGATWQWLDSTDNSSYGSGDHLFSQNLTYTNKVVADPTLDSTGDVIVYAALGGSSATAGIWRSIDSGTTWKPVFVNNGDATDVTLDPISGTGVLGGNLEIVYGAFPGKGVYTSPNQGQSWFPLLGTTGDPLLQDFPSGTPVAVNPLGPAPVSAAGNGRILLAKPYATSADPASPDLADQLYEGWLYALVDTGNALDGLYLTKDFGQNWTKVHLASEPETGIPDTGNPSNDATLADFDPFAGNANAAISFAIDPTNSNVVYIGGTTGGSGQAGFMRVDTTGLFDPHSFVAQTDNQKDGGLLSVAAAAPLTLKDPTQPAFLLEPPVPPTTGVPTASSYLNLIRDPLDAFNANATLLTENVAAFNNTGADAKWFPISSKSAFLDNSTGQHALVTFVDPLTGHARLIAADDHGIFSGVDDHGSFTTGDGTAADPLGSRNGNLALTQFYYGAVQPSAHDNLGDPRAVLTYGGSHNVGGPTSSDFLTTGSTRWTGPDGNYYGVATDPTGSGTVYRFVNPGQAGTNFFQVNGVGRTFNLTTGPADPQWFGVPTSFNNGETTFGDFTVNSVNGNQIVISSDDGSVYRTENLGVLWVQIAGPTTLDGDYAPALAFGAPDPSAPNGIGNLDNFIYAGTLKGNIYATQIGGGSVGSGNAWILVGSTANGLDGSTVQKILTSPTRGSHAAYAVTLKGVYFNPDTLAAGSTWQNITGNLFSLTVPAYGNNSEATPQLTNLVSMQVDWRYVLPGNPLVPGSAPHPVLYVSGDGGVFRSLDNGTTWTDFPTAAVQLDGTPALEGRTAGVEQGYLPNVKVTDLSLATGNVNPQTGRATALPGDPSLLVASTFGRGQFAIRLSPLVIPNTPTAPAPNDPQNWLTIDPADRIGFTVDGFQATDVENPIIDGYSEQSAFGNSISVALYNLTAPGSVPGASTAIPMTGTLTTDGNGHFSLQVAPGYFSKSGYYTIGVQATDQSGGVGNVALLKILVELPPPPPPTKVVLEAASDSGTFNNDDYTFDNNTAAHPAPVFDVSGILPGATVVLLRNGVVVNTVANTAGGVVAIADTNGGHGQIPDSPVGTPIDTAPPAGNPYLYTAYQIDTTNYASPQSSPPLQVIVDSTAPAPPTTLVLDPASDSGTKNNDNYTFDNNSPQHPAPVFDVSGIEPNATVVLLRDGVIVNEVSDTAGGMVQIADTNGAYNGMPGNGPIPDSPVGSPPDTAPPAGNAYTYTTFQIDLAGNVSGSAGGFGNTGAVVLDGTDSDLHGSGDSTGNMAGWLYMQRVLTAIQPNVSDGQKVLVALGPQFNVFGGTGPGTAAMAITSAFKFSPLPGLGWSLEFVNGTANENTYLSGSPAAALDPTGASIGTVTLGKTGLLYITSSNETFDDLTDADLVMLNTHGPDIKNFVAGGGGLYTQTETPTKAPEVQNDPPGYGWLTSVFPGIGYFSVGSGGAVPTNIQITTQGQMVFPGLTSADLSTGPWHGFFTGTFSGGLVPMFTDTYMGNSVVLGLASLGGAQSNQVIIDSTPPLAPPISLDAGSDSGTLNNDQVTQDNNGNPYPAPVFDLTGVEPNAVVQLFRAPVVGGVVGTAVLVNTQTAPPASAIGPFSIADTNAGNGKIPDGTYAYTAKQTDLAGNVGPLDSPVTVVIDATPPAAPSPLKLDPASDTGTFNNDQVTRDNNSTTYGPPFFDVSGVEAHANVLLFRAKVTGGVVGAATLVNTLVNVPAGGALMIPDTNAGNGIIADGTYQYSAKQVDLAGNAGPLTNTVTVVINTAAPTPEPPPAPMLEPGSDTGTFNNDQITQDNNGNPYPAPIFDVGSLTKPVGATETVQLFRAPVVNGVVGPAVLVNTLTNVKAGVIAIPDINAGNGKIPDGTYMYTDQLTTLSGVPGTMSAGEKVVIDATVPAAPSPFRLDAASDTGVSNSDGITQITLIKFPVFDVSSVEVGATVNLFRDNVLINTLTNTAGGTVLIPDPNQISDGTYTYTVDQVDLAFNVSALGGPITVVYDTAQPPTPPIPVLDPASDSGIKGDDDTSDTSPFFDVTVSLTGFEADSSVSLVRDGSVVASTPYNVTGGAVKIQDPGSVPFGKHTYQAFVTDRAGNVSALGGTVQVTFAADASGTLVLDPTSDSGVKGDDITNVTSPILDAASLPANEVIELFRDGKQVNSAPTGGGGLVLIGDPGPLGDGKHSYYAVLVTAGGTSSPAGPTLTITVDTKPPAAPSGLTLDPASDSGVKGDDVTNVTNPTIDVSSIAPGATVQLLRNGLLVASVTSTAGGTVPMTDPGPLSRGTYVYTAKQISVAGNASPVSPSLTITIDTSTPSAPTLALDPASDSGVKGDDSTAVVNPFFDASGVTAGATVSLFRNGNLVATLANAAAGTDKIQDPGPLAAGSYTYTAQQTSAAGNSSGFSPPLTVTITVLSGTPAVPSLALASFSDTGVVGDGITAYRELTFVGSADVGVVVYLFRAGGTLVGSGIVNGQGQFAITLASNVADGTYLYQAKAVTSKGVASALSPLLQIKVVTVDGDYTGGGDASFALFRRDSASLATWHVKYDPALNPFSFGSGTLDVPVAADFNGDGKDDPTVYRPSTGQWFTALSGSASYAGHQLPAFGGPRDIPVPADYNGTGSAIESVFRPATGQWFFYNGGMGHNITDAVVFPVNSQPEPGDYDGVGKAEAAVFNPATSQWLVAAPGATASHVAASFGGGGDIGVPGQYDDITLTAAGKPDVTEAAVWRPTTGQYFIQTPGKVARVVQFAVGDVPTPGDWDGIGETEPAVYRPSTGQWLVEGPNDKSPRVIATYGGPADIPLVSPYPYRSLTTSSGIGLSSIRGSQGPTVTSFSLDFGSASLGMTKGPGASPVKSPAPASPPVSVASTTVTSTTRTRPKEVKPEVVGVKESLFDHAIHKLAATTRHKRHGHKRK